ncbi:DUF4174 domain-containing protein [Amaricoccus sp.]|uniref:DUF4174 domain-containing protein n=1 Tax=Amaricoccus sp. TaxID=1872485 RepID=UPI001B712589|nr:DUF4174 domain-containing protein [Amaricoccus sp.]MBP7000944.1 DUF4174 domain-containing protein [Amaricoccus sp.]
MPIRLAAALVATLAVPALAADPAADAAPVPVAAETPAETPTLAELLWVARPLVIFADTPHDPRFAQQMALLDENMPALDERLVVVLTDVDPAANGPLRRQLRPRGFGLVLLDTDGSIVQRRPAPTTVRELSGMIDRLPSRRQETGSRRR